MLSHINSSNSLARFYLAKVSRPIQSQGVLMGSYLPIMKGKVVMKKTSFLHLMALLLVFGTTASVVAEESVEEMEKRCYGYAEEDKISADELDDYIKECIQGIEQDDTQHDAESETESEERQD